MKLKEALKKFNFLQKLDIHEDAIAKLANQMAGMLKGDETIHKTPLCTATDPIMTLCEWKTIMAENEHRMNEPLLNLEKQSLDKFGPRSISVPWSERKAGLKSSFDCQKENRSYEFDKFNRLKGLGNLYPEPLEIALQECHDNTAASLPFMKKKEKCKKDLMKDFWYYFNRRDPAVLYTRTTEKKKTRNVWGFPFAQTVFEMTFFLPFMVYCKQQFYHASLVSEDLVAKRITELVLKAIETGRVIYSVDFAGFDASVWYQFIIKAFDYIKSCFHPIFGPMLDIICEIFYTIPIVTPSGVYRRKHGVPSGSTFTNLIDCIVQVGLALNCPFVTLLNCLVNGDDGLYIMFRHEVEEFEQNFLKHGLKLEKSKSEIATNFAVFCQHLYHIDYIKDGVIGGIFPTYRALNRLMYQEKFVAFNKMGIAGKDYYGIRAITILEKCKYHPLHEELVRFVVRKEKYKMDISADSILKYAKHTYVKPCTIPGDDLDFEEDPTKGIRNYVTFKLVEKILAEGILEEEDSDSED